MACQPPGRAPILRIGGPPKCPILGRAALGRAALAILMLSIVAVLLPAEEPPLAQTPPVPPADQDTGPETVLPAVDAGQAPIARVVRRLGSDSYLDRNAAEEELAALGAAGRRQLEEAVESPDPEVRLRAKGLLRRLKTEELWSAGIVSYACVQTSAASAMEALSTQTGNRLMVGDQYGAFHDQKVDLDCVASAFWPTVDHLCRLSGNRVRPHYDTRHPGLVLVAGPPGRQPVAYSGPVRAQVTSARRVFTEELDYEQLASQRTHTFQLDLHMMWEDRFKLVAYRSQPELIEAQTDTGISLPSTQPSASGWNVSGPGTRQVSMNVRLHPPATTAECLSSLKLKWGLIAVGDMDTIEIKDLSSAQPHFQDDVELVVEHFQQGPGPRCEVTLVVVRDLVVPEPQELMYHENDVALFDAQGRAFRQQGQTNSPAEPGIRMKLTFVGESAESAPHVLRFVYPRIRAHRELEIAFRDVPLPVGKPE